MFSLLIFGTLLFVGVVFACKVTFFILGVLLSGAGFIIKSIILLLLLVPLVPIFIFIVGNFISVLAISLIIITGISLSCITPQNRSYWK